MHWDLPENFCIKNIITVPLIVMLLPDLQLSAGPTQDKQHCSYIHFSCCCYNLMIVMGHFNTQPMGTVLKCFMKINGFLNLIKNKTSLKGQGSAMDLILTKRKYSFKNSSIYSKIHLHKIDVSGYCHLIYSYFITETIRIFSFLSSRLKML